MIYLTILARAQDGLPLAASVGDDEDSDQQMLKYNNQAKMLFRKLTPQSPKMCSLETGDGYVFHYLIEMGVCYLCLCDHNFPDKTAFAYLQTLHSEFSSQYGHRVDTVTRPYHFIEFDGMIQTTKKRFVEGRGRGHLSGINAELQDVQRIMIDNIDSVIHRGEALTILDDKAANLSMLSKKYKEDARYLNRRSTMMKVALVAILVVAFLLYWRFF